MHWDAAFLYISFTAYYVLGVLLDFGVNRTVLVPSTLAGLYILITWWGTVNPAWCEGCNRGQSWGAETRALPQDTVGYHGRQLAPNWGKYFFLRVFYADIFTILKKKKNRLIFKYHLCFKSSEIFAKDISDNCNPIYTKNPERSIIRKQTIWLKTRLNSIYNSQDMEAT